MAEFYSDRLRTLALDFKNPNPPQHLYLYSNILYGAADRIDDLQKQLAERVVQVVRLTDKVESIKKPLSEEDKVWIDYEAARKFREWNRQGVRGQIIYEQDSLDYWTMVATYERLKNR